jgi:hypothetical protein
MKTIVGSLPDCPNGTVTLSFPRPAKVISTGLPAPGTVEIRLDSGGNVPAGTQVWGNDEMEPGGAWLAIVRDGTGKVVRSKLWPVRGASPIVLFKMPI